MTSITGTLKPAISNRSGYLNGSVWQPIAQPKGMVMSKLYSNLYAQNVTYGTMIWTTHKPTASAVSARTGVQNAERTTGSSQEGSAGTPEH